MSIKKKEIVGAVLVPICELCYSKEGYTVTKISF